MSDAGQGVAAVIERAVAVATIATMRGDAAAVVREQTAVATVGGGQGPAGPPGVSAAAPTSYALDAVASITARHGLPFAPEAWIVTAGGEVVEADVLHAPGMTTVVFPAPFIGTLYLR